MAEAGRPAVAAGGASWWLGGVDGLTVAECPRRSLDPL